MLGKIDHLGIAVKSLEDAIKVYADTLGVSPSEVEEVESQKVRVVFFEVGESRIELLEATSPESPIAKFIEKKGPGFHHVAYGVEDIEQALADARKGGARLLDEKPKDGAHGARIAFIHPKSLAGVLTELCQRS